MVKAAREIPLQLFAIKNLPPERAARCNPNLLSSFYTIVWN
jgi:hypothetical protein